MQNSLVSVVLPVYNGEKYLTQSIESVLNQTYKNLELIIVNDNSSDNSLQIAESFASKDNRVKIITNKTNQKLPESLNIGFRSAVGDYYTWTSDDNFYHDDAIEKMVCYLENNKDDAMVCADFYEIDDTSQKKFSLELKVSAQDMINRNCVGACFLYRKEIAQSVGEYNKEKFLVEDYDYWLRVMLKGNIGHIPEFLYTYRIRPESLSGTKMPEIIKKTKKIQKEYFRLYKKKYNVRKSKNMNKGKVSFLEQIFSVKNEKDRKVVRILGIKIKFKRKAKKQVKIDYLNSYNLAKKWIEKYTVNGNGIVVESNQPKSIYPEVTGYYIPSLIRFGDRNRAISFGNYLLTIQNEDGSWNEPSGKYPYTFDTGMILKGLSALIEAGLDENDKYKNALVKGADYILSMQRENGSIATVNYDWWELPYNKQVPEAIHVYCLEPIRYVGKLTNNPKYEDCIKKALNYYLSQVDLTDFTTLSHFNAYIIEGLIDIGERERAQRAMDLISLHQRLDGSVSAYSMVDFVCSTGLLQYAICWYKLGEVEKADRAFDYVCKLQNKSGGFYGTYKVGRDEPNYFPQGEIAWAVKYFLDAIYYGQKAKYDNIAHIFLDEIDENDGRYQIIKNELKNDNYKDILDLGCGKARYTKKLVNEYHDKNFYCVDLSKRVLETINLNVQKNVGSILNIPYKNESFDFIFACESLEHAIDIKNAINEIIRVLKPHGKAIIIDKDKRNIGQIQLADFETWFDKNFLENLSLDKEIKTSIIENIPYENKHDRLFNAWGIEK